MTCCCVAVGLLCMLHTAPLTAQWEVETKGTPSAGRGHVVMTLAGQAPDDAFAILLSVACVPRTPELAPSLDPVILVLALGGGFARFDGTPITAILDSIPAPAFAWRADSAGQLATLYEGSALVAALAQAETLRVELPLLVDRRVGVTFALGNFGSLFEARVRPTCATGR
jgi:hypothetical protein